MFNLLRPDRLNERATFVMGYYIATFPALAFIFIFRACVESSQNLTKVITWKRTTSSRSSSSRIPLAPASKEDNDDSRNDFVEEFCMIAGSHSSTLDRLYAWERKLYDEIKVLG